MSHSWLRFLLIASLAIFLGEIGYGQSMLTKRAVSIPEPGLEQAIRWKWRVEPSNAKDWGLPLQMEAPTPAPFSVGGTNPTQATSLADGSNTYQVKKGDALILISKKYGLTVDQLKVYNGLTDNKIIVGQILKIPTAAEMPFLPKAPEPVAKPKKSGEPQLPPPLPPENAMEKETLALQVFLDREQFSVGPIKGKPDSGLIMALQSYQTAHPEFKDIELLKKKVQDTVEDALTTYTLKEEDFRFIAPPKAEIVKPENAAKQKKAKSAAAPRVEPLTYEEMVSSPMLAYRSPWAFVAERFHCDATYLKSLNSRLGPWPPVGSKFQVPDVIPFEIERIFDGPLQPSADPQNPVKAVIVNLTSLEIYQGDKLVAMMPLASARPGLKGKGFWTILDVIPRPRLATLQEPREVKKISDFPGMAQATPTPFIPSLSSAQYLPPGPRNPVGIIWINLSKEKSTEALPYGLHGTSIPSLVSTHESIGGFRLANWDIARAVRLLPYGTPLEWK